VTDTANRVLWTVVGLVLLAAGVVGVLVNRDWLPGTDAEAPLLWPDLVDWWRDLDPWGLIGLGLLGAVVAVLGLILLLAELRRGGGPQLRELRLANQRPGHTRVRGPVVGRGLERDLARSPGVRNAAVSVTGTAPRPELWIRLDVDRQVDLGTVRQQVDRALDRFTRTYGLRPARVDVTTRVAGAPLARVR
jgi:hypothetical protein